DFTAGWRSGPQSTEDRCWLVRRAGRRSGNSETPGPCLRPRAPRPEWLSAKLGCNPPLRAAATGRRVRGAAAGNRVAQWSGISPCQRNENAQSPQSGINMMHRSALERVLRELERQQEHTWDRFAHSAPLKLHWRALAVRHSLHILPGEKILEFGA